MIRSHLAGMACLMAVPVSAQTDIQTHVDPIVIGETIIAQSRVMDQERRITVYLPQGYAESSERFPVLYLIDGGIEQDFLHISGTTYLNSIWGRSRPVIVVGIETLNRRAELTAATSDQELLENFPTSGKSAQFRRFIRDEVIPMVETRYRTNGERGVIGESLAGLFIIESALIEPALFQRHAAISASLWWDNESLSRQAAGLLATQSSVPEIYLTIANEGGEMDDAYERLLASLSAKSEMGEGWCSIPRRDLTHGTIYHTVSPQALQYLFPAPPSDYEIEGFEPPCGISAR